MNRLVQILNFLGIFALAVLCAVQWRQIHELESRVNDLDQIRIQQASKIEEQDSTIKGEQADLDEFRSRLEIAESMLRKAQAQIAADVAEHNTMIAQRDQLIAERDALKKALAQWTAAAAARDQALKQAGREIQTLAAARNDAILKFNDLATKYNTLVQQATTRSSGG
jgi:chromosome segregation ATPase